MKTQCIQNRIVENHASMSVGPPLLFVKMEKSTKKVNTLRIDKHKNSFESDLLYFQKNPFRTIISDTFNYTL